MKRLLAGLLLSSLFAHPTLAQKDLKIRDAKANPDTRVFNDGKTSLASYIYYVLENETSCCGTDAIYLEVKLNAEGKVEAARSLTGRNECLRKSIVDIVKNVQFDNASIKGSKSIYFELKPAITCKGLAQENSYRPLTLAEGSDHLTAQAPAQQPATTTTATTPTDQTPQQPPVTPEKKELTTQQVTQQTTTEVTPTTTTTAPTKKTTTPVTATKTTPVQEKLPVQQPNKNYKVVDSQGDISPVTTALPKPVYVSAGDRKPQVARKGPVANMAGPRALTPEYIDGESAQAVYVKQQLRKAGICGPVHVLAELTVQAPGTVVASRIFRANTPQVLEAMPAILTTLKYKPETVRFNEFVYFEFKADVDCPNQPATGKQVDLSLVPNFLKTPENEVTPPATPIKPSRDE